MVLVPKYSGPGQGGFYGTVYGLTYVSGGSSFKDRLFISDWIYHFTISFAIVFIRMKAILRS